jgi:hypothetical protein
MNLYLLTQEVNTGYDSFDSTVVCAESLEDAKTISPYGEECTNKQDYRYDSWCKLDDVVARLIGVASDDQVRGVVVASFNAG